MIQLFVDAKFDPEATAGARLFLPDNFINSLETFRLSQRSGAQLAEIPVFLEVMSLHPSGYGNEIRIGFAHTSITGHYQIDNAPRTAPPREWKQPTLQAVVLKGDVVATPKATISEFELEILRKRSAKLEAITNILNQ